MTPESKTTNSDASQGVHIDSDVRKACGCRGPQGRVADRLAHRDGVRSYPECSDGPLTSTLSKILSEDTSNMMVSSYFCFLATATSTAQQNTTSSPSEDDPKADLSGLGDRAVNPGRRISSCSLLHLPSLPITSSRPWDASPSCDWLFLKRGPS